MYYTLMYNLYICTDQLKERTMKSPFQYGTMVDKECFVNRVEERKQLKELFREVSFLVFATIVLLHLVGHIGSGQR